jgi:glycosyltransferase involved in cell wall biosynthesis
MKFLAEEAARRGHEVRVLTMGYCRGCSQEASVQVDRFIAAVKHGKLANLRSWLAFSARAPGQVRRAAAEMNPEIVASFFLVPAGWLVARTISGIPHVTTIVGADIHDPTRRISPDRSWLVRRMAGRAIRHAAAVTAGTRDMVARTQAVFPGTRVYRISLGVPPLAPDRRSRTELGLPEHGLVVATLSRLVQRKRLDLLLRAMADLRHLPIQAVIMGFGPAEQSLRQLAAELGISHQVRFTGAVSEADKAAYLGAADIFCLPSEHEAFGLVFVEAMSLGTPVITTNVGGQTDIVREGIDGFLIPTGDHHALADRLVLLHDHPERLAAMQPAARERATRFTPQHTADGFLELFASLVGESRQSTVDC